MKYFVVTKAALCCVALSFTSASLAHITLEQSSAPADSDYKAVFRVGHGCDASPVESIQVTIPAGVTNAKPMPKAGWKQRSATSASGATTITWTGGPLADSDYDEFVMRVKLPNAAQTLYFPVTQTCTVGSTAWDQTPSVPPLPGEKLKRPAAELKVTPAGISTGGHAGH